MIHLILFWDECPSYLFFFFSNKIAVQLAKAEEWEILGKDAVLGKFHCTNSSKEKLKRYENLFQPAK